MTDLRHPAEPVIVRLPAEIDLANAEDVGKLMRSVFTPGVTVVIADLTSTVFCDSTGMRQLFMADQYADAHDAKIHFAIPGGTVRRVLKLIGMDELLSVYPSLGAAMSAGAALDGDAATELSLL